MRTIMVCQAWAFALASAVSASAQTPAQTSVSSVAILQPLASKVPLLAMLASSPEPRPPLSTFKAAFEAPLPDAPIPEALLIENALTSTSLVPCSDTASGSPAETTGHKSCFAPPNPYSRFLDTPLPTRLTPAQKAVLAIHNLKDPGNLVTIVDTAAFTIAANPHTAYGPGWKGFGKNAGVSLLQDATGEFFGTFLIPSLVREDPHYHRMPHASVPRRFVHALAHTVIAQDDNGRPMLNYSTLLTYPISSEISNLYVPGIRDNGPSTVARILTGYATDPIENEITEFLPDLAKHIHIHVIFVQRILNQVASDQYALP